MRGGFLGFLGEVESAADIALAAERGGLGAVDVSPGRILFASENIAVRRDPDGAIILGDCFSSRLSGTRSSPDWGNFVAFCARGSELHVERAALTGMPIYWSRRSGGVVVASEAGAVDFLTGPSEINWDYVAASLAYINLRCAQTGLSAVQELLPGTSLAFDGQAVSIRPTWTPWDHVSARFSGGFSEAASELQRRIVECVSAWSASRCDILVELSGGLDSSIVTAALKAASADFSAITFATPDAEGDERIFARAVASHCAIDLAEVEHDDRWIDLIALPEAISARPGAYSVLSGLDRAFADNVLDHSLPIFGGIGGDSVFQFDTTVAPILDSFRRSGPSRRACRAMRDVARASGATIWEAARLSWRAHRAGPRLGWRRDLTYLVEAAMPARQPAHPWDADAQRFTPAKRNHVESIRRILDFLDRPGRWHGREVFAPLLSAPVVEFCLSVPSDYWYVGGRNRAVARAAFADHLPAEIVWRQGKGRMEALCAAAYLRQRSDLRDLLLGGRLAERGMLDAPAIEAYLKRDLADGEFDYFRLIEIGDTERWVRAVESGVPFGSSFAHR